MSDYITKDSGKREEYASGMRRDTQEGKPDYTLIDRDFLTRWAELMVRGAEKYGRENWRKANSTEELERFQASAFRHLMQWLEGDTDEDHAVAVAFNIAAAEFVKKKIKEPEYFVSKTGLTNDEYKKATEESIKSYYKEHGIPFEGGFWSLETKTINEQLIKELQAATCDCCAKEHGYLNEDESYTEELLRLREEHGFLPDGDIDETKWEVVERDDDLS